MYDVVIIGGGASGSALFYTLARYSSLTNFALLEKYASPGQVNSKASNNSQTLHVGDIETNYSLDKVKQVRPASMMLVEYARQLPKEAADKFLFSIPKMVLGVGKAEMETLRKRFADLSQIFPELELLEASEIAKVEPAIMKGRKKNEPVLALYNKQGYAVNFEELSRSFIGEAQRLKPSAKARFNSKVERIEKSAGSYTLILESGERLQARAIVVDADSYSLLLAKRLGYGKEYSLIPIAGTFYFSPEILKGKVYSVQEPKLPFAAVHGDPDVEVPGKTRWGPTARFHPVLESFNFSTSLDYLRSSGLMRWQTWISFAAILLDPIRFRFLIKNMLYELPGIGKWMFVKNVHKIAPSVRTSDLKVAEHYGGMRLQRVDTHTRELQLGEGKIIGDGIIFNMTPSPGASVCLYNALRDAEELGKFLSDYTFSKGEMERDLVENQYLPSTPEVSLPEGYAA